MKLRQTLVVAVSAFSIIIFSTTKVSFQREREEEDEMEEEIRQRILGPLPLDDIRLVSYVKQYYLYPPSTKPYNLSNNDLVYKKFAKEDTWKYIHFYVKTLFLDEPPGFFVEAGALDGEYLSNTLWLEQRLRWTGLLVEPDKEGFRHLNYKNRRAWTTNTCLSNQPFAKETVHVSLQLKQNDKVMRIPWNHRANSHEFGVTTKTQNPNFSMLSDETYFKVQCFPLNTFLLALNVSRVDFLSLDIQGGEKNIIRNLSWQYLNIRVMVVENIEDTIDEDFLTYMESKGYVLVNKNRATSVYDYVYVRSDEKALLEKLEKVVIV